MQSSWEAGGRPDLGWMGYEQFERYDALRISERLVKRQAWDTTDLHKLCWLGLDTAKQFFAPLYVQEFGSTIRHRVLDLKTRTNNRWIPHIMSNLV